MTAVQIIFQDEEKGLFAGILINEEFIICAECGSIFEKEEVKILKRNEIWRDFTYCLL